MRCLLSPTFKVSFKTALWISVSLVLFSYFRSPIPLISFLCVKFLPIIHLGTGRGVMRSNLYHEQCGIWLSRALFCLPRRRGARWFEKKYQIKEGSAQEQKYSHRSLYGIALFSRPKLKIQDWLTTEYQVILSFGVCRIPFLDLLLGN